MKSTVVTMPFDVFKIAYITSDIVKLKQNKIRYKQ